MICGIDEAGRGATLGPLVIAGFLCAEKDLELLERIGVRDSKKLSKSRREKIYRQLAEKFKFHVIKILPRELDERVGRGISLNELEGAKFAEVINVLRPSAAYIDCADVLPENFRNHILKILKHDCDLTIEHRADERYLVVGAASIIAKVERDAEIEKLKREYGDIGSGYPADEKTIAFIQSWYKKNRAFPDCVRKTWKTIDAVKNAKLAEFL